METCEEPRTPEPGDRATRLSYSYDRYGNGTCVIGGSTEGPCPQFGYNQASNRISNSGYTYDAAGNALNDSSCTYQYDAEGRVKYSSCPWVWQYPLYNALGQRVEDYQSDGSSGKTLTYPRDIFGHRMGIWDQRPSINWVGWDVWYTQAVGQKFAVFVNTTWLKHADAIGSTTMIIDNTEALVNDPNYYPWGQGWHDTNGRSSFASLENPVGDPLYPSATREYNNGLGRWMTPDPGGVKVVSLANPQTWNMYAYALDNPTTLNDPTGLHGQCSASVANSHHGCKAANPNNLLDSRLKNGSAPKQSWWKSLTGAVVLGIARVSPSTARRIWEVANPGQKVPFDTVLQRYYDMAHLKALADGGTSEAENLVPMEHGAHMAQHMENGDFVRWAGRAKQGIEDAAKMEEEAAKQSVNDVVNDFENGAQEFVNNPAQAVEDAITSAAEAVETGEEPFPP